MVTRTYNFTPISRLNVTNPTFADGVARPLFPNNDIGQEPPIAAGTTYGTFSLTGKTTKIQIEDDANAVYLNDDVDLDGQSLAAPLLGFPAGTWVETLYSYSAYDASGHFVGYIYTIAIGSGVDDTVQGIVSDFRIVPGVTYSVHHNYPVADAPYEDTLLAKGLYNGAVCFAHGTRIDTPAGPRLIEDLQPGDMVKTVDNGPQAIRWIGRRELGAEHLAALPNLRPVRIRAGSLGDSLPASDLVVSPQHRMLVRSKIAQRMFSADEVLVPAKQLLAVDGIEIAEDMEAVIYYHLLFDHHEIVTANGAPSESLYTGAEALKSVGPAAREEIFALFPEMEAPDFTPIAARHLATGREARQLAERHSRNGRALVGEI